MELEAERVTGVAHGERSSEQISQRVATGWQESCVEGRAPTWDWAWLAAHLPAGVEAGYDGMVLEVTPAASTAASPEAVK